jgi:hypothetical protein
MKMTATKKSGKLNSQHQPKTTSQKWKDDSGGIDHPLIDNSPHVVAQAKRLERLFGNPVQRVPLLEEEEELMQGKFATQLQTPEEEEELLQGKFSKEPLQPEENKTGMPDHVKNRMENTFGTDFSDVKIHSGSSKATDVGALAYTQGTNIHFAPGQFKPDTSTGRSLLGHELAHVIQQSEGRVQPTGEVAGLPVNDNPMLEKEADEMGKKA